MHLNIIIWKLPSENTYLKDCKDSSNLIVIRQNSPFQDDFQKFFGV